MHLGSKKVGGPGCICDLQGKHALAIYSPDSKMSLCNVPMGENCARKQSTVLAKIQPSLDTTVPYATLH